MEAQKIDRLSLLPRELLDYIFELGLTCWQPPTVPPSKHLLPSHHRALYQNITIGNTKRFLLLLSTLESDTNNGSYVKTVTWNCYYQARDLKSEDVARFLRQVPNIVEMNFGRYSYSAPSSLFAARSVFKQVHQYRNLLRFSGPEVTPGIVEWIKRQPNLRRIELGGVSLTPAEEEEAISDRDGSPTALQVKEVVLASPDPPSNFDSEVVPKVYRLFPSAQIVSVRIDSWRGLSTLDMLTRLLEEVKPTLRDLELRDRYGELRHRDLQMDHLLPRFDHLRHLHLDPGSYSDQLPRHLASVKSLTSLSLYFFTLLPSSSQLIPTLSLLPNLRIFILDYYAGYASAPFDISRAESRIESSGTTSSLKTVMKKIRRSFNLDNMASEEQEWYLPFHLEDPEEILDVVEWEKEVRELGFEVRSNIERVIQTLRRHIVEYNNRGIAQLYFDGETEVLQYARQLARQFNFELPPFEMGLDDPDLFNSNNLEWFEVDLTESVRVGGEPCIGLGLRYKEGVETEKHEDGEELSQRSEEGSDGE